MKTKLFATAAVSAALLTGGAAALATTVLPAYAQGTPTAQAQGTAGTTGTGQAQHVRHPRLRKAVRTAVTTAAHTIGIAPKDLATELRAGKSIADVARAHDVDPQKVIDAYVADADARIDKAVQDGKLDQAKADQLKAKVPERATKIVNATRGTHQDGERTNGSPATPTAPTPSGSDTTPAPSSTPAPTPAPTDQLGGDTTTAPSGSLSGG